MRRAIVLLPGEMAELLRGGPEVDLDFGVHGGDPVRLLSNEHGAFTWWALEILARTRNIPAHTIPMEQR